MLRLCRNASSKLEELLALENPVRVEREEKEEEKQEVAAENFDAAKDTFPLSTRPKTGKHHE